MIRSSRPLWRDPALFCATVGGSGLLRPMPGTWGSVVASLFVWVVVMLVQTQWLQPLLLLVAMLVTGLGLLVVPFAQNRFRTEDPGEVVIDEAAGIVVASSLFPGALLVSHPVTCVMVNLLLFRIFDIAKPWPISRLDALPGRWGVMLDDVAAGLCAGCCGLAFFS